MIGRPTGHTRAGVARLGGCLAYVVGGLLLLLAGNDLFQSAQEAAALASGESQVAYTEYDPFYGKPVAERTVAISPRDVAAERTRAVVLGVLGVLAVIAGAVTQGPPWRSLAPTPQRQRDR